ncbi:MAG TPA: Rne/Rng family ribonuclease, partial [Streptosporangiaceae bacterium]|nr:Rne/Rng family ribonuclease [Streptosporangiaceae bacterium]
LEGQPKRIESALKAGQSLIAQVTKDPVGHKGARLTSQISLPGRYLVYVPGASMTGISRKLPDTERTRLKKILKKVMPEDAGVIVRTAAEGATEEELSRDVARLTAQWENIERKAKTASAPELLYGEPDLTIRVIRDVFNEDFSQLIVEGQPKRIESALKAGQSVIVQVTKDPVGHKGARLTSQVSLPGRYLVYVPGASMTGISRKLPDTERNRLKQILKKVMPEDGGVIVRTAAEGAAEEELSRDVARLAAQWEAIEKKAKTASAPALLYSEPDLTIRVIRDVFNEDFAKLVVSGDEAWDVVDEYVKYVAPHLADRVTRWEGDRDAFAAYRIDEQLAKALDRKVWLPSGGSLVIDKTEAMTVIDVNTGKFTGQGGNLEETVTRNNLEAAEEIVRQLRLRDVGGIVVIDFIDMVLESNRELVLRRLLECLARDRTKHQVAEVTSLGLVQMTRKRVGAGLLEAFSVPCECCNGRGVIVSFDPEGDTQASHHVHQRGGGTGPNGGGGNGGNGSRGGSASPASIAARVRTDAPADASPASDPQAD